MAEAYEALCSRGTSALAPMVLPAPQSSPAQSELSPTPSVAPMSEINIGEIALQRTGRTTAGQHANVSHLPRAVSKLFRQSTASSGPVSGAISALFRPWKLKTNWSK